MGLVALEGLYVFYGEIVAAAMEFADLQRAPLVKRCVLEAIRLHAPGTVARRVTKSFTLHVSVRTCSSVLFTVSLTVNFYK